MLVNADITLFERENYTPHFIPDVYFSDSRRQTITKNGVQVSDSVVVYIYSNEYLPKSGDIVVKNRCNFLFGGSLQNRWNF